MRKANEQYKQCWLVWSIGLETRCSPSLSRGARCSSAVRAFAHGAMVQLSYSGSSQCSTTSCGMCYPVYGMMHRKE